MSHVSAGIRHQRNKASTRILNYNILGTDANMNISDGAQEWTYTFPFPFSIYTWLHSLCWMYLSGS